jgi:RHS repeat-associated protein
VAFAHDGAGRLTGVSGPGGTRSLSWDTRGVLASVTTTAGALTTTTARTTDGDGTLVSAATTTPGGSATTGFTWDPSLPVPQVATTSTGGADTDHLYGTGRALALRGGQSDAYAADAFGSTLAIGEASDLARAGGYDEFGVPTSGTASSLFEEVTGGDDPARFGYRGEAHLGGTVHLRAREYAPGLGRFTTVDPLAGVAGETTVANPYHYADNDPLDKVDPLGLRPLSDRELALKIGFAGTLTAVDPWLSAFIGKLFDLYNENHREAVRLAAGRIAEMMNGAALWVDTYRTSDGLRPDLVALWHGRYYFWEVKPNSAYGEKTGTAQLLAYDKAMLEDVRGTRGPKLGTVTTPMSSTGGLYVHDAPATLGLIYYEKDQRKLREKALEHANDEVPESAVPIVVPVPAPVLLPG